MASIKLTRMNGLGNDFLIYDARKPDGYVNFTHDMLLGLCSRNNKHSKGCDQFIFLEKPTRKDAHVRMIIFNSDGSEVYACGNATRCVTRIMHDEGLKGEVCIETKADLLKGKVIDDVNVSVDMNTPSFHWEEIPLDAEAEEMDTKNLPIDIEGFSRPFAVSMGNPHMVFTTDKDVESIDVVGLGKPLEHHRLFPERVNVGFAQIVDQHHMNLRVFERGAGETLACGTGACAAVVAAISRGLCISPVNVHARGGDMTISWKGGQHSPVIMTGPAVYEAELKVPLQWS